MSYKYYHFLGGNSIDVYTSFKEAYRAYRERRLYPTNYLFRARGGQIQMFVKNVSGRKHYTKSVSLEDFKKHFSQRVPFESIFAE